MSASTFNFQTAPMETDGRNGSWLSDWNKTTTPYWHSPAPPFSNFTPGNYQDVLETNFPDFTAQHMSRNQFLLFPYKGCQSVPNKVTESNVNYGLGWMPPQQQPSQPLFVGGTNVKFRPTEGNDVVIKNGITNGVKVQFQCITNMPEYQNKSIEELRFEDYVLGRGAPYLFQYGQQTVGEGRTDQCNEPSLLDIWLHNVIGGPNQNTRVAEDSRREPVDGIFGKTPLLLQALLNNIKQRFNLNDLSEETRRSCEKLTHTLMEFTERTLENIAVVVLEDMLNSIKQRKNTGNIEAAEESSKPEKTVSCSCKPKDSKKNQREKSKSDGGEKSSIVERKKPSKLVNYSYCSSDYDEDSEIRRDDGGGPSFEGSEHRCSSTRASKSGKKTPSDDRHETKWYGGRDRRHSPHLILRYKKRAGRRCDGNGHKCCSRDEIHSSRANETMCERKKNLPSKARDYSAVSRKKKQHARVGGDESDECYICEHFKMVSVNETSRECAAASTSDSKKEKNVCPKKTAEDDYDVYEEERDGIEHELFSDHSVDENAAGTECDGEKCVIKADEKLESDNPDADFSDSSSI